jgi:hypothetical protein
MGAGTYRDCAKKGKHDLGGNIKSVHSYHSTPKKMANGGRVKKYADGDEVEITRTDPFKDDSAGNTAFAAREDYEAKQAAQRAQEAAYSDAGQRQRMQDVPAAPVAAAGMGGDREPEQNMLAGQRAAAAAAPVMGTAATEDRGYTPALPKPKNKMQAAGQAAGAAAASGDTSTAKAIAKKVGAAVTGAANAFSDRPSGRPDSPKPAADKAGDDEEGESGWDRTPMGRGWKSLKKAFSGASGPGSPGGRPGLGGGKADGGTVKKVKKA